MLKRLHILNFALIEEAKIDFNTGFTVITGETGSGKSILLNALNLILGERADFNVIGNKSNKSIVEATFQISIRFNSFFEENDLDFDDVLIVRREILKEGKSRAFINDTPVQLNVLKILCSQLIQIHSQYNTLELKSKSYQLELLDILAGLETERNEMTNLFGDFQHLNKKLHSLETQLSSSRATQDYNQFVLNELFDLKLDKTDYSNLEVELNRIENAETLKSLYHTIIEIFDTQGLYSTLKTSKSNFDKFASTDSNVAAFSERLNSLLIELKELSSDASKALDDLEFSGLNSQELTEKLDAYNRVLSKHRLTNQVQLRAFKEELESKVTGLESLEAQCDNLSKELKIKADFMNEYANELHEKRILAAPSIENQLKQILCSLKLPDTDLKFELNQGKEINFNGNSEISFLFSANKGMNPVPVEKAASGGELSRVMLALQKMVSEKRDLPTILFDEIDTGVSGDVAQKIGHLLNQMGEKVQLIAISHLPQVAAKAENHLVVAKKIENQEMKTRVYSINEDERVLEIARLLSGEQISDAALSNAKNLMLN
jgi:DNA repair protein RecN (Recombination protein N)